MTNRNVHAQLTYLAPSVESSLYRNGKVFHHRDPDGNDDAYHGAVMQQRDVSIRDARGLHQSSRLLEMHGFELLHRPLLRSDLQFLDHRQVVQDYYPECAEIVRRATNATQVFAFDHNVRSAKEKDTGKRVAGGQQVQEPIHVVHGDYTLTGAPRRLRDLATPPSVNDTLRTALGEGESLVTSDLASRTLDERKRFALINVWRNIDCAPVMSEPLALCDGLTIASDDLVVLEVRYQDRTGENYLAKYSPLHEWWYYPLVTRDEVILLKTWDSAGTLARSGAARAIFRGNGEAPCTFSFHTAFRDPNTPTDAPDRQSIEVRCVAFFA